MIKKSSKLMSVRFGPSPTGGLHAGGVRTALYNYFLAKKHGGRFILRVEDTDRSRYVEGAEQYIVDSLRWLGIEFDESPELGGKFGPYRQSERTKIYDEYVEKLINDGLAYYAFDTADELAKVKENNKYFMYNSASRINMKNSLSMSKDEVDELLSKRNDWVVRIKYPDTPTTIKFTDEIRGDVSFMSSDLDDKVLWKKKDNLPTYHLANVVDDHLMEITHVIRGEEWLPSAPLHVYLYQCLGWDKPSFSHLPLIMGPNGKLSKRDGAKYGFPVFPMKWTNPQTKEVANGYKEMGYSPAAVINILSFLGWNPGTEKEVYTIDELIQDFKLSRVNKAGAKFSLDKAKWFNGQHLRLTSDEVLFADFKAEIKERKMDIADDVAFKILSDNKNKVNFISEIFDTASYLFNKPTVFDKKALKKWKPKSSAILADLSVVLSNIGNWVESDIQIAFESHVNDNGISFGDIAPQVRLTLTGKGNGPSMFGIMEMIGKDETIDRINSFKKPTPNKPVVSEVVKPTDKKSELETIEFLLNKTEKKLSDPTFSAKAPKDVVEKEVEKMKELTVKYNKLKAEC